MAYDTKYRPVRYDDVLGQESHVAVLREFVARGKGFHQSYLFAGQHGSGKTTLGRILARALLCENPKEGDPCDECPSCVDILTKGHSECFSEYDAASNSTKQDMLRVIESIEYSTFAGKQRVYLFDEAHRLSKASLDALLKPLEDEQDTSENKRLVCIFCTTEPEKMVSTVFSRCAPQFTIKVVSPEVIADRLAWVCEQEGVEYEKDALITIASIKESHIRDALKTLESIALLGPVNMENVRRVLNLDANESLARILLLLGSDLSTVMADADRLVQTVSPTACYERLSETAMLAYKVSIGAAKPPPYWRKGLIEKLGEVHGDYLVAFAKCFSSRPRKPTSAMLSLDLAQLHQMRIGSNLATHTRPKPPEVPSTGTSLPAPQIPSPSSGNVEAIPSPSAAKKNRTYETPTGRYIDQRGIRKKQPVVQRNPKRPDDSPLDPAEFTSALTRRLQELRADESLQGPTRSNMLGGSGAYPAR